MNVQSQIELLCQTLESKADSAESEGRFRDDPHERLACSARAETLREVSDAISVCLLGVNRS